MTSVVVVFKVDDIAPSGARRVEVLAQFLFEKLALLGLREGNAP